MASQPSAHQDHSHPGQLPHLGPPHATVPESRDRHCSLHIYVYVYLPASAIAYLHYPSSCLDPAIPANQHRTHTPLERRTRRMLQRATAASASALELMRGATEAHAAVPEVRHAAPDYYAAATTGGPTAEAKAAASVRGLFASPLAPSPGVAAAAAAPSSSSPAVGDQGRFGASAGSSVAAPQVFAPPSTTNPSAGAPSGKGFSQAWARACSVLSRSPGLTRMSCRTKSLALGETPSNSATSKSYSPAQICSRRGFAPSSSKGGRSR